MRRARPRWPQFRARLRWTPKWPACASPFHHCRHHHHHRHRHHHHHAVWPWPTNWLSSTTRHAPSTSPRPVYPTSTPTPRQRPTPPTTDCAPSTNRSVCLQRRPHHALSAARAGRRVQAIPRARADPAAHVRMRALRRAIPSYAVAPIGERGGRETIFVHCSFGPCTEYSTARNTAQHFSRTGPIGAIRDHFASVPTCLGAAQRHPPPTAGTQRLIVLPGITFGVSSQQLHI